MKVAHSCPALCDPMNCSLPGSSVHGILQARILEWVAVPFSRGSSQAGTEPRSPTLQADFLLSEPPGIATAVAAAAKLLQSCLTLCDPIDCSSPGSSAHGILQARILEQVAISFSRGSSQLKDRTHLSYVFCIAGRFFTH